MKIAVVTPKMADGEKGGAENLYEGLVNALNKKGHDTHQIEIVIDESSFDKILESYCRCFYLDLNDYDLVISTKAPTYMVRHRNHISYLLHTIRVFYDRFDKEFNPKDEEIKKQQRLIHEFDKYGLDPVRIKKHYVIGQTVVNRLKKTDIFWNKINFEVIPPATKISNFKKPSKGEFIFLPSRLHKWKRIDLIIRSMKFLKKDIKLLIAGTGEDKDRLKKLAKDDNRIEFLGNISDEELVDFYSRSIVIPFVPIDEDYGYITIEAFKSKKPVITCTDSGEPVYIVKDGINGFIVDPDPEKIAEKINYFIENQEDANRMGENGYNSIMNITWEDVISKLLKDIDNQSKSMPRPDINVLITDMQPIEPAIGGSRLRLKGLYSNLGQNIKALYVGTYDWKGPKYRKINISDTLLEIDIPLDDEHFRLNEYINKLLPDKTIIDVIFPLLAETSSEYVKIVRCEARKSDVIVIAHPWLYPILKTDIYLKHKILVYDSHNCEVILREQILGETPFARCLTKMVKFVEKELCEDSDLIIACSESDKEQYEKLYNIDPNKIEVFPNSVFVDKIDIVDKEIRRKSKEKLKIDQKTAIFIGSEYYPNVEAGKYITEKLAQECPNVYFLVVGGVGNKLGSRDKKNVKIFGNVSEEEKKLLYAASDIAINPMLSGSGTNIKMLDYLASGIPTVASPMGARGIDNDGHFIVTDVSNFPKEIDNILSDQNLYKELSTNGRMLVEKRYDWNKISRKLGNRLNEIYFSKYPYFSIIVPTRRGEHIYKLIEKLNQQIFKDFELIIVDSGTEKRDTIYGLCNFKVKYIFKEDIGATKARNLGIKYARGKMIAFTDDDCQPDHTWLRSAKEYFKNDNIVGLEGYIYTDDNKLNDSKYRIVTNKGFEGIGFMTANLFIRHDIIEKIGGFDERFDNPHFREDTDIAWRAQNYGYIPYGKNVCVYHPPHLRDVKGESKKDRDRFFINDALLFVKHQEKYIKLMKIEEHYKYNKKFWKFFIEGCKTTNEKVPIELILKDSEISRYIPDEIKKM